jgi:hypothetical protein
LGLGHLGSFPLEDAVVEGVFHEREFDGCEIELKNPKNPAGTQLVDSVWMFGIMLFSFPFLQELSFCVLILQKIVPAGLKLFS